LSVRVEGVDCVTVEGRREDDGRTVVEPGEMTRGFDTVHIRHANIEQDDIG